MNLIESPNLLNKDKNKILINESKCIKIMKKIENK